MTSHFAANLRSSRLLSLYPFLLSHAIADTPVVIPNTRAKIDKSTFEQGKGSQLKKQKSTTKGKQTMNKKMVAIVNTGSGNASASRRQFPVDDEGYEAIHCSCDSMRSCSTNLLADCIAVCCCPCVLLNILVLAFVKLPWVLGKKSIKYLKRKTLITRRRKKQIDSQGVKENVLLTVATAPQLLPAPPLLTSLFGEDGDGFCACFEAERVWTELYQVGHLGFGRVSFQEIR